MFAVTDHNCVDWYPVLREEGDKQGVYVFPGVEVSVNRCHLLVVRVPFARLAPAFFRAIADSSAPDGPAGGFSAANRAALFHDTAARVYRIDGAASGRR